MSSWQVICWWERRRLIYNAVLFAIGIISVACLVALSGGILVIAGDGLGSLGILGGIALYGLAANACYTLGWILELQEREDNPSQARVRAEKRYRVGLRFSAALTTAPLWFGILFRLVMHLRQTH